MGGTSAEQVTRLLMDERLDDGERANALLPLVYEHLRNVARHALAAERPDHTLQPTALVHEAYLRLVGDRQLPWANQGHFYAAAAEAMRHILLDHARARNRKKRGGDRVKVSLADVSGLAELSLRDSSEIVRFDEAFRRLEEEVPDAATVVRLRFYAGLNIQQTAEATGVSKATVERRWAFAKAWLYRALHDEASQ